MILNPVVVQSGVKLPELTNPGTAADLLLGKELIGPDGKIVTGSYKAEEKINFTRILSDAIYTVKNSSGKTEIHLRISGVKKLLSIEFAWVSNTFSEFWYGFGVAEDSSTGVNSIAIVQTPTGTAGASSFPITITDQEIYFQGTTVSTLPETTITRTAVLAYT